MAKNEVIYLVVVVSLFRAFTSLARELELDIQEAERLFKDAKATYNQDPYSAAIIWDTPLDQKGLDQLYNKFRHDLGQWLSHGLSDGLVSLLHRYLREEILHQLETVARERQRAILEPIPAEGGPQGLGLGDHDHRVAISA